MSQKTPIHTVLDRGFTSDYQAEFVWTCLICKLRDHGSKMAMKLKAKEHSKITGHDINFIRYPKLKAFA